MADSNIVVSDLAITPGFGQTFARWVVTDPNEKGLPYLKHDRTELWAATANDRSLAIKVAEGLVETIHAVSDGLARYYWIKPRNLSIGPNGERYYGEFYPASPTGGVEAPATALLAENGYQKFPSGVIMQWGSGTCDNTTGLATITLPIPFPNAVFSITGAVKGVVQTSLVSLRFDYVVATAISQFDVKALWVPTGPLNPAPVGADFYWEAKGY